MLTSCEIIASANFRCIIGDRNKAACRRVAFVILYTSNVCICLVEALLQTVCGEVDGSFLHLE